MNSSTTKKEARLFNLMKNLRDRKKKERKRKRKKNLLSFQGPSPLVCPIFMASSQGLDLGSSDSPSQLLLDTMTMTRRGTEECVWCRNCGV
jgi:hypothetical protein